MRWIRRSGKEGDVSERVVTTIRIKVFERENKRATFRTLKAGPGKYWTDENIDNILTKIAADLEARFPMSEYRLVELPGNAFNFVWTGERDGAPRMGVSSDLATAD